MEVSALYNRLILLNQCNQFKRFAYLLEVEHDLASRIRAGTKPFGALMVLAGRAALIVLGVI